MGRMKQLINRDWKFMHGDFPEAKNRGFDDAAWYDIGLPHSFGIPYFMENEFYVGYGCYRKELDIEEAWIGKQISLEFQGVFQDTEVYVNGRLAGSHQGGYTAFEINITEYVQPGENLLYVRVNNLWNPRLAPRAGEHVFNGGIYRDVSLIVTEPVHVAWYGTYVAAPQVTEKEAELLIQTEVCNDLAEEVSCQIFSVILYEGTEVACWTDCVIIAAGKTHVFRQNGVIHDPHLWHPEHPYLYTLKSIVFLDDVVTDCYETTFGIRWFRFDAKQGFSLNGEQYDILGANVHQDHAGWSDAVTHTGIARDISMIRECGMNFIRGSHYPHHTFFAEECDRQGMLFWSENCFWGTGGPKVDGYWTASGYPVCEEDEEAFEESCARSLREMIRTNRNHPSIIVWSMCNEPFFSDRAVMEKARKLLYKLVDLSHELDPYRPAAVGGVQRGGFDVIGDLAGYNGDGAAIFHDPGFPNFVSEYGSTVEDRPGEYSPRYTDGVEVPYDWRSGKSLWCGFHHGSILGDMGHMGMIDYYRLPLRTWYWYRENLRGIARENIALDGTPYQIKLTGDRAEMSSDGTEDVHIIARVEEKDGSRVNYDGEITLQVIRGGGLFPTGKTFVLSAEQGSFIDGLGAIELRSYYAGETVIRAEGIGLRGDELSIAVTGDVQWNNPKENLLQPPPYVTGAPKRDHLHQISVDRPVFFSSASAEHPAKNVSDGKKDTFWYPEAEEQGAWVLLDLEGTKPFEEIRVQFVHKVDAAYDIAISGDRENFSVLFENPMPYDADDISVYTRGEQARFIRVRFPEKPIGIVQIEVLA